jgi:small subunit ribosomal protein S16
MVKIRLMRMGATKRPFFRVVVADSRSPRDGRFIENIGKYRPLADPSEIEIDQDRALYWLSQGAQPTEQVVHLLRIRGIWDRFQETKKGPTAKGGRAPARSKPASGASASSEAPSSA